MANCVAIHEAGWKLFRGGFPDRREACMDRLNRACVALLAGSGTASNKFWKLEKRIRRYARGSSPRQVEESTCMPVHILYQIASSSLRTA